MAGGSGDVSHEKWHGVVDEGWSARAQAEGWIDATVDTGRQVQHLSTRRLEQAISRYAAPHLARPATRGVAAPRLRDEALEIVSRSSSVVEDLGANVCWATGLRGEHCEVQSVPVLYGWRVRVWLSIDCSNEPETKTEVIEEVFNDLAVPRSLSG